jgi:hypothetical protein
VRSASGPTNGRGRVGRSSIASLRQRLPFILLAIVVGLGAASYFAHRPASPPSPPSSEALARHGCTLHHFPSAGHAHVDPAHVTIRYVEPSAIGKNPDGSTVLYNSFPPTSGPHSPVWMAWGTYAVPVPQIRAVHNLEHGGIVICSGFDRDAFATFRDALRFKGPERFPASALAPGR